MRSRAQCQQQMGFPGERLQTCVIHVDGNSECGIWDPPVLQEGLGLNRPRSGAGGGESTERRGSISQSATVQVQGKREEVATKKPQKTEKQKPKQTQRSPKQRFKKCGKPDGHNKESQLRLS